MVSPSDIGFIAINQQVNLQVDAFNYNQWGLGKAVVVDIDRNLTLNEQQAFFRVKCKLLKSDFSLKNGYQAKIKKGMTLTARFMVVERSLWDLLFDKVDDWFNPKTMSISANS
ncbi:MAG: hypothetical protein H6584_01020 [Flavobacteriales bacterium]|nr:hypothetical protein [Flavobacteriales bacterium]